MGSARVILGYQWKSEKLKHENDDEDTGLTDLVMKVAKKELREDKSTREECLRQVKSWIEKNEDIENTRLDDMFLLRFLRVKKFSIPMAEQTLLKYLNLRRTFSHMSTNLDCLDPKLNDVISSGYIFVSPIRDRSGRRVCIINAKHFNPKLYTSVEQAKAHFLTYETLLEDPVNQILGVTHVGDFSGISTSHLTIWNPTEFARVFKWGEQSVPMRHKEIHLVNVPASLKWLIDFVKTRVSSKIKNRLACYTNIKDMNKCVDVECLPLELGGSIPMKDMIESWKKELASKKDLVLTLDKMKLLNDRGIITSRDRNNNSNNNGSNTVPQIESVIGSFRKLEFD